MTSEGQAQTWGAQVPSDVAVTLGNAAIHWRQLAEDMERQRNEAFADRAAAESRASAAEQALEKIAESADRWSNLVINEQEGRIHRLHRDMARAALVAAAAAEPPRGEVGEDFPL